MGGGRHINDTPVEAPDVLPQVLLFSLLDFEEIQSHHPLILATGELMEKCTTLQSQHLLLLATGELMEKCTTLQSQHLLLLATGELMEKCTTLQSQHLLLLATGELMEECTTKVLEALGTVRVDVCMVVGSLATLDLPMVVDLIGIFVLKGPYCTLTMTDLFLQALSLIPRGSWGDVARRFTMIRWIPPGSNHAAGNFLEAEIQKLTLAEERTHRLFSKASKSSSFTFPLPAQFNRLKRVANKRSKQRESSATKISKNRGWMRRKMAMENHDEQ
ncbi:putative transaminase (ISS) [Dorcoceras hygrometricum]|uniref:Putative transaminase (ISS) n=1 Tax=Dorcoceras hygrometricum TaxID=472368 RepID=A0A2Z7B800_9LAMI|nr:putative transaminase (ISS) [Dorcoceras hygrometricum]